MGRIVQRPRYSVKNTVVELRPPCQADCTKAECAFSQGELASLEDDCTKGERAFSQAEEYLGSLEAIDENAEAAGVPSLANWTEGCCGYCSGCLGAGDSVPSTPSPMLRPTLLPPGMGYLPPFDLGLPPACGLTGLTGFHEQGVPGVYIPALPYNCGFYLPQGFTLGEQDGTSGAAVSGWNTETETCELDSLAMASVQTELLLEALSDKIKESREACGQARERQSDEPEGERASSPPLVPRPPVVPSTVSPLVEAAEVGTPEERAARRERGGDERCVPEQVPVHPVAPEGTSSSPATSTATAAEPPWQPSERGRSGKRQLRKREAEAKDLGRSSTAADEKPITFTTVMLRNIPNKYTRDMLVSQLNLHLRAKYDFVYLPMDFKNGCNVGYGFINFRSCEACKAFVNRFSGVDVCKCLPGINNSSKVAEVTPARVQGLEENVRRLRSSPVMQELVNHPEWMPLVFDEEGVESPLPLPEGPLPPIKHHDRGHHDRGHRDCGQKGGRMRVK